MRNFVARWVNDNNLTAHFPGVVDSSHCSALLRASADRQQNGSMIDHESIALHHAVAMIVSADIDNGIRLFKNGMVKSFCWVGGP